MTVESGTNVCRNLTELIQYYSGLMEIHCENLNEIRCMVVEDVTFVCPCSSGMGQSAKERREEVEGLVGDIVCCQLRYCTTFTTIRAAGIVRNALSGKLGSPQRCLTSC